MTINDKFWFDCKNHHSIKNLNNATRLFSEKLETAKKLEGNAVIFLDTNVLTDYYKISTKERILLKGQFNKYKERIILTKTVEEEFLRNRTKIIRNHNKTLEENLVKRFNKVKSSIGKIETGTVDGLEDYFNNKVIKNDFTTIAEELQKINEELEKAISEIFTDKNLKARIAKVEEEINKSFEEAKRENTNHEKKDQYLDILSSLKVLDELSEEETNFITKKYHDLLKYYKENNSDEQKRILNTFPGCGEKKKDHPENDFIIFHEMMQYMKTNEVDVIFLTNDTKKSDWIKNNGQQFIHYTENVYANTGQIMYILDARETLNITYDEIYTEEKTDYEVRREERRDFHKSTMSIFDDFLSSHEIHILYLIFEMTNLSNESVTLADILKENKKNLGFNEESLKLVLEQLRTEGYLRGGNVFSLTEKKLKTSYSLTQKSIELGELVAQEVRLDENGGLFHM